MQHDWDVIGIQRLYGLLVEKAYCCRVCLHIASEKDDSPCLGNTAPPACDFCSDPTPLWEYPAETHSSPGIANFGSEGSWLSCQACHDLREREGDDAVTWRAAQIFNQQIPQGSVEQHYEALKLAHNKFIEYRTGKPFPFHPEEPKDARYRLVQDPQTNTPGILCLRCGLTSYHQGEINQRYCGHCRKFHSEA